MAQSSRYRLGEPKIHVFVAWVRTIRKSVYFFLKDDVFLSKIMHKCRFQTSLRKVQIYRLCVFRTHSTNTRKSTLWKIRHGGPSPIRPVPLSVLLSGFPNLPVVLYWRYIAYCCTGRQCNYMGVAIGHFFMCRHTVRGPGGHVPSGFLTT